MKFDSLLVVTYGRSGSTLLQGILDSIPGYSIKGENADYCYGLFQSYKSLVKTESMEVHDKNVTCPWFGASGYNINEFLNTQRELLKKFLIQDQTVDCFGFKEIRYVQHLPDFDEYLNFLNLLLPNVAFVFNTRDKESVSKSKWWAEKEKAEVFKLIEDADNKFHNYANTTENSIVLNYQRILDKSDIVRLYEFLGVEYNEDKVNKILNTKFSY